MTKNMRVLFISCALLVFTIGSYAVNSTADLKQDDKPTQQPTEVVNSTILSNKTTDFNTTTAVPQNATAAPTSSTPSPTTLPPAPTTSRPTEIPKPVTTQPTAQPTAQPTVQPTTQPSTASSTTAAPTTAPAKPTTVPTVPSSPTTNAPTAATSSSTTAVPVISVVPPTQSPSKERHFDGLSFVGGIILATCLVAIGVFSWKFNRIRNPRNYRTL